MKTILAALLISLCAELAWFVWKWGVAHWRMHKFTVKYRATTVGGLPHTLAGSGEFLSLIFTDQGRQKCSVNADLAQERAETAKAFIGMLKAAGLFALTMALIIVVLAAAKG